MQTVTMARPLKIAALGDIMLDRDVGRHFFSKPSDFAFEEISELLNQYDLVIANLENPCGLTGQPHPKQDPHVAFRCHPDTLAVLKTLGVDVVTLANNHLLDYGETTLIETIEHLDNYGIKHLGAGKDYQQANRPLLMDVNGHKVALLASVMIYSASTEKATRKSAGVADYSPSKLIKTIKKLRAQGYQVIVTIHWGIEYCFYPIPYQRQQAQQMIDAGASVILGHGPHFPQGIETYHGGEIVHSLGNFIFDEPYPYSKRSFIYGASLDPKTSQVSSQIYPVTLKQHCPSLDPESQNNRTAIIVQNFGKVYQRKTARFWKTINNRWFSDIIWRVTFMKSARFLLLPPLSFYTTIGFGNFLKKINKNNIIWVFKQAARPFLKSTANEKT